MQFNSGNFLLFLIGIIVVTIVSIFLNSGKIPVATEIINVTDYPFKTGDLIIMYPISNSKGIKNHDDLMQRLFGRTLYHIAVVFVCPVTEFIYIWEMTGSRNTRLNPLIQVNSDPKKYKMFIKPINRELNSYQAYDVIQNQCKMKFNDDVALNTLHAHQSVFFPILRNFDYKENEKAHCSSLAYDFYIKMGVFLPDGNLSLLDIFPQDFSALSDENAKSNIDVHSDFSFEELVEIDITSIPRFERKSSNK